MQLATLPTFRILDRYDLDPLLTGSVVVAALLHIVLIFFVTFESATSKNAVMQDVTLVVNVMRTEAPKKADFLSQANQLGGGQSDQIKKITNSDISPLSMDLMEYVNPNQTAIARKEAQESSSDHRLLFTTFSWQKSKKDREKKKRQEKNDQEAKRNSTASMIATLEAEFAKTKQEFAKKTSIKTVDSVMAKSDPASPYVDSFKKSVERVGNKYYPDEAKQLRLSGDVRLMVILRANGSIKAIRLLQSSGSRVLDEAAKSSVRYGAPYKKFPVAMNQVSELRIIRTWRYKAGANAPVITTESANVVNTSP